MLFSAPFKMGEKHMPKTRRNLVEKDTGYVLYTLILLDNFIKPSVSANFIFLRQ